MHKENDFRRSDFLNAPVLQQPRGEEWSKSINHMVIKQRLKNANRHFTVAFLYKRMSNSVSSSAKFTFQHFNPFKNIKIWLAQLLCSASRLKDDLNGASVVS